MVSIRKTIFRAADFVVGRVVNTAGRVLPERMSHAVVMVAWTLGFGRGVVTNTIVKGVGDAAGAMSNGVKDVFRGVGTAVGGVGNAGKQTLGAAFGVARSTLKVVHAHKSAKTIRKGTDVQQ